MELCWFEYLRCMVYISFIKFFCGFGLIFMIIVSAFLLNTTFALSPSFPRQKLVDHSDWKLIYPQGNLTIIQTPFGNRTLELSNNATECLLNHDQYYHPSGIDGVTYLSDGRTLNATLWLSDVFKESPLITNKIVPDSGEIPYLTVYGMSLAIHTTDNSPITDYTLYLMRHATSRVWEISLIEHSPSDYTRIAYNSTIKSAAYRSIFGNGSTGYVNLSFDLARLNYPNQYDLFFYAQDNFIENGRLCRLVDITQRIFVPPPEFVISTNPSSLILRPGEAKNIVLQLKSNTRMSSLINFSAPQTNGLQFNFSPNETFYSISGNATSLLHVKALDNDTAGVHLLPLFANESFPKILEDIAPAPFKASDRAVFRGHSGFLQTVTVLPIIISHPPTFSELISTAWDQFTGFFKGSSEDIGKIILGAFASAIVAWVIKRFSKKRKTKLSSRN
jgi:hypothetical protein